MKGYINGISFMDLEAEKYWSFPAAYKGDKKIEIRNMIMSGEYVGARKIDGCYYRFIKDDDGNMILQGRSESVAGGYLDKIEWVPQLHEFFNALPNGTCLLGEIYFPDDEGSKRVTTIMGCGKDKAIARQVNAPKLHYYIFDIWALNGLSLLSADILWRIREMSGMEVFHKDSFVSYAQYLSGAELWDALQEILSEGGEGVVMTRTGTCPEPGKRPARKTLKVKKEIETELDCFLTGAWKQANRLYKGSEIQLWKYWQNIHTGQMIEGILYPDYKMGVPVEPVTKLYFYGFAGAVGIGVIDKDGNVITVGWISGITDDVREAITEPNNKYIHQVVKVTAMEIDKESGALRHGKIVEFRNDKGWMECSNDQLVGL